MTNNYTEEVIDLATIPQKDLQEKYVPYYVGQKDPKLFGVLTPVLFINNSSCMLILYLLPVIKS